MSSHTSLITKISFQRFFFLITDLASFFSFFFSPRVSKSAYALKCNLLTVVCIVFATSELLQHTVTSCSFLPDVPYTFLLMSILI